MPAITLPEHWTAREALVVYEFLAEIQECLWCQHGAELMEAYRIECGADDTPTSSAERDFEDDDIEF